MDAHRKKRLQALIDTRYRGDRGAFIAEAGISKGRVTQLLSPSDAFGERAAKALIKKLDLEDGYFEKVANAEVISPINQPTNEQALDVLGAACKNLDTDQRRELGNLISMFVVGLRQTTKQDILEVLAGNEGKKAA